MGPVNQLTRQPIKGRKNKGGIRLGEMERDALLSHGAAFLLHDRLMNCSDRHVAHVCATCGSLLSTSARRGTVATAGQSAAAVAAAAREGGGVVDGGGGGGGGGGGVGGSGGIRCITCPLTSADSPSEGGRKQGRVVAVAMPYVFRYLANELAGMGIKLTLKTS